VPHAQIRNVAYPDLVCPAHLTIEAAIGDPLIEQMAPWVAIVDPGAARFKSARAHQSRNPFSPKRSAAILQGFMDPWAAIGRSTGLKDLLYLLKMTVVLVCSGTAWAPPLCVVADPGNTVQTAHQTDLVFLPVLLNEREDRVLSSEQNRMAFLAVRAPARAGADA